LSACPRRCCSAGTWSIGTRSTLSPIEGPRPSWPVSSAQGSQRPRPWKSFSGGEGYMPLPFPCSSTPIGAGWRGSGAPGATAAPGSASRLQSPGARLAREPAAQGA